MPNARRNRQTARRNKGTVSKKQKPVIFAPRAIGSTIQNFGPNISASNSNRGVSIRIRHSERIATVYGSTGFVVRRYEANPGNPSVFKWLSIIAAGWESYTPEAMSLRFVPTITTKDGSIIMVPEYDALDDTPNDSVNMSAYEGAVESSIWQQARLTCPKKSLQKFAMNGQRFVRQGAVSGDLKTYDAVHFMVATEGCADTSIIGKLYIDYDVVFHTPQRLVVPTSMLIKSSGSVGKSLPLGTHSKILGDVTNVAVNAVTNALEFRKPGSYLMSLLGTGVGISQGPYWSPAAGTNATVSGLFGVTNNPQTSRASQWLIDILDATLSKPAKFDLTDATATSWSDTILRINPWNGASSAISYEQAVALVSEDEDPLVGSLGDSAVDQYGVEHSLYNPLIPALTGYGTATFADGEGLDEYKLLYHDAVAA